jgi:peptide subunit release factor 1 (eRF1)
MNMECNFCGYVNNERQNIYGTFCPKCGEFNKPKNKIDNLEKIAEKNKELKEQVLEILRKRIEGVKDANRN